MITTANIQNTSITQMATRVFRQAGSQLVEKQDKILNNVYVRRTGRLSAHLKSHPYVVKSANDDITLEVTYYSQIRFMDLKQTRSGKKKKRYAPIYNKYVWGFLVAYTYNNLRLGLANSLKNSIENTELEITI